MHHSIRAFTAPAELCIVSALQVTAPVRLHDRALRLVYDTADASKQRENVGRMYTTLTTVSYAHTPNDKTQVRGNGAINFEMRRYRHGRQPCLGCTHRST